MARSLEERILVLRAEKGLIRVFGRILVVDSVGCVSPNVKDKTMTEATAYCHDLATDEKTTVDLLTQAWARL